MISQSQVRKFLAFVIALAMTLAYFMSPALADDIDLEPYITGGTVGYQLPGQTEWTDIEPASSGDVSVPANADGYRISLQFKIPEGTLSEQDSTLTYQLPGDIKVYPSSGDITEKAGSSVTILGQHQIDANGQLTLKYNAEAIEHNQTVSIDEGVVRYALNLSGSGSPDSSRNVTTQIGRSPLTIHFKLEPDLGLVKQVDDSDLNHLKYTLTVSSVNGTDGQDVSITDTVKAVNDGLIPLQDAQNIQILDSDGQPVESWKLTRNADGFEITGLPLLAAGAQYIVTYDSALRLTKGSGQITAENTAQAAAGTINSQPSPAAITCQVNPYSLVKKEGALQSDGRIKWTIVINEGHHDIGGFKLDDLINDAPWSGSVSIDPPVDGSDTISIPFTFPRGTNQTYTITYITDQMPLGGYTLNTARMTPPGSSIPALDSSQVDYSGAEIIDNISKTSTDTQPGPDGTAIVSWNINLQTGHDGYQGQVELSDYLYDHGLYYTLDQLKALYTEVENQLEEMGNGISRMTVTSTDGNETDLDQASPDGRYKAFNIFLDHELSYGQNLDITCQATADVGVVKDEGIISNQVTLYANNLGKYGITSLDGWSCSNVFPTIK